ncbi:hypothetical protein RDI58_015042 [Solanum bulbocastanum]|uniref:Uncharacterized protein n=1 Tax=Solanum bulbocastanum TaxID=147425 RepID=A0AAN8TK44_SOLBU
MGFPWRRFFLKKYATSNQ